MHAMHSYACRNVEQIVTEYHESVIFCIVQNNYHSLECSVQSQPETKRQYLFGLEKNSIPCHITTKTEIHLYNNHTICFFQNNVSKGLKEEMYYNRTI